MLKIIFAEDNLEADAGQIDTIRQNFDQTKQEELLSSVESDSEKDNEIFYRSARWIQRVEIKNFKAIRELVIDFPDEQSGQSPWLVLLGENSVGKSSILQAVALTLMGEEKANALDLNPKDFINRNHKGLTTEVNVYLTSPKEPVQLRIDRKENRFRITPPTPLVLIMGYGSTRLLNKDKYYKEKVRIRNLFDPLERLNNVENWLGNPREVAQDQFEELSCWLKQLLMLDDSVEISRTKQGRIDIRLQSDAQPLSMGQLSDGYKSVAALALDIMLTLSTKWSSIRLAEGIVLIDEIETHLHPRWKMQFISLMRSVFPRVRFLVTTHDPLCLRGLRQGEIVLMDLDEAGNVVAHVDLPDPTGLSIDQLLTSRLFGLNTSLDPKTEKLFNEYYKLLALPDQDRTPEVTKRIDTLKGELNSKNQKMGKNPREQFVYEVIDKALADQKEKPASELPALTPDTISSLAEIWNSNDPMP